MHSPEDHCPPLSRLDSQPLGAGLPPGIVALGVTTATPQLRRRFGRCRLVAPAGSAGFQCAAQRVTRGTREICGTASLNIAAASSERANASACADARWFNNLNMEKRPWEPSAAWLARAGHDAGRQVVCWHHVQGRSLGPKSTRQHSLLNQCTSIR